MTKLTVAPHNLITIRLGCRLNRDLLGPWEELTEAQQTTWKEQIGPGAVPCEGEGITGIWCGNCRFGDIKDVARD